MFVAIAKFFSSVVKFILGLLTGLLNWVREHPRAFAEIMAAIVLVLFAWGLTKDATTRKVWAEANVIIEAQKEEVEKANKEAKERDAKIDRIEKESKKNAGDLETALKESRTRMTSLISDYEKKLYEEKQKYKVIYVKDPNTGVDIPVNINPQGEVVCQRLPQSFVDTVNELIREANAPLTLRLTK